MNIFGALFKCLYGGSISTAVFPSDVSSSYLTICKDRAWKSSAFSVWADGTAAWSEKTPVPLCVLQPDNLREVWPLETSGGSFKTSR